MSQLVSEPLSDLDVFKTGFRLFRESVPAILLLALVIAGFEEIPELIFPEPASGDFNWDAYLAGLILSPIPLFLSLALLLRLDDIAEGRSGAPLRKHLSAAKTLIVPVLASTVLYVSIVALGTMLLIVPGIFLSVSLSLYLFFQIFEGAGITESLKRSRALLEGNWWHAATVLFITFLTGLAMTLPPTLAAVWMVGGAKSIAATFVVEICTILGAAFGKILMSAVMLTLYRNLQVHAALQITQSPLA